MVIGQLPFSGQTLEEWVLCHLQRAVPPLTKEFPKELNRIIQQCVAKRVNERQAGFRSIRDQLRPLYERIAHKKLPVKKIGPVHPNQLRRKGIGLADLGELSSALVCFDRSIEADPDNAATWICKANVLGDMERIADALECFDRAIALDPKDGRAWSNKAVQLLSSGRLQEALSCAVEATKRRFPERS